MKIITGILILGMTSISIAASDIELSGVTHNSVQIKRNQSAAPQVTILEKQITLLDIQLSHRAKQVLERRVKLARNITSMNNNVIQGNSSVKLGMNNVPVLDQGVHGTCVTFASTAAIDAIINKGNYISQLCQLELGKYIANNSYGESGWDGAWASRVLHNMDLFGIVSIQNQHAVGCGGLFEYPSRSLEPNTEMSLQEYHPLSENLSHYPVAWSTILDPYQAVLDSMDFNQILNTVKNSLNSGDRVLIGTLLPAVDLGIAGAVGKFKNQNDTWVITPEIIDILNQQDDIAGHEMVITGYDDYAIAKDQQGRVYKGLLTLRNSWGQDIGDSGDFYMSYAYFKAFVIDLIRIRHLQN